ncbi:MAG: hypothetical protein AB1598_06260 [Thermodesulfobacteriota bacterium]
MIIVMYTELLPAIVSGMTGNNKVNPNPETILKRSRITSGTWFRITDKSKDWEKKILPDPPFPKEGIEGTK